jgi:hypothetical protein
LEEEEEEEERVKGRGTFITFKSGEGGERETCPAF